MGITLFWPVVDILTALKGNDSQMLLGRYLLTLSRWFLFHRRAIALSPQASIRGCPPLLHGVLVSLGQVKHPTGIAWFSLTAGEYSIKTPDYFGIDFTLPTVTVLFAKDCRVVGGFRREPDL